MATRKDINVDFNTSPRIIEVEEPSVEVTMQDLVDTLRIAEEGFTKGLAFPKVTNASGKDDLGGGVSVGITTSLQDAKLSFEARRTPAETGAVTTGSVAPVVGNITFVDTNADFSAANIVRGSLVINFTDLSVADVFSVDSSIQLTTKILVNGITDTYQIGDVYHVFNIIQVNAQGGNLVALDANNQPIDPILPTAFTQVVRTSSSSATLQNQESLNFSSYGGGVTIDTTNGTPGVLFPIGTLETPVDNLSDALLIAGANGLATLFVLGSLSLNSGDFTGFTFRGIQGIPTITIDAGANVTNAIFDTALISGTLDPGVRLTSCEIVGNILNFNGTMHNTLIRDTITLNTNDQTRILDCWSDIPGLDTPAIDMGGDGPAMVVRNYSGGLRLSNKTGTDSVSIDLVSGQVILDATVTNGTIVIRGVGGITDNSVGATVISSALLNDTNVASAVWDDLLSDHTTAGTFGGFVQNTLLTVAKFLGLK